MADWNLRSRSHVCEACGRAFAVGAAGHTLLFREAEGWARRDLCAACFRALPAGERAAAESAWTFSVPPEAPRKVDASPPRETAEALLRRLLTRGRAEDEGVCYILAILLERSRRFTERGVGQDAAGRRVRLYERKGSGELFSIVDPEVRAEDVAALQQRVLGLLEGRLVPVGAARVLRYRLRGRRFLVRRRARGGR